MVGRHTARIVRGEWPAWEDCAFIVVTDEALAVTQGLLGINDGEQRMQGAIGIPDGEDGIVTFFRLRILMNSLVHTTEAAIDILIVEGGDVCVVESGVEVSQHGCIGSLDANLAEEVSPDAAALGTDGFEVPVGKLRL